MVSKEGFEPPDKNLQSPITKQLCLSAVEEA